MGSKSSSLKSGGLSSINLSWFPSCRVATELIIILVTVPKPSQEPTKKTRLSLLVAGGNGSLTVSNLRPPSPYRITCRLPFVMVLSPIT